MLRNLATVSLAALAAFALGCASAGLGKDEPVAARVGDEVITVAELDESIKVQLYDLRSKALKSQLSQRALEAEAKKRNLTVEAMLNEEFQKLPPVDDAAVKDFYEKNKDRARGAPLEAVAPQIKSLLEGEAKRQAVDAIIAKTETTIVLERPRVQVGTTGPARGPADARVTIVEFSDFQCPFCARAKPVLDEVEKRHPKDVRIVYRHLPLDSIHPRARPSAEASACAAESNKFWEYHDRLFANNKALSDADLRKYASEVGLDAAAFDECLKSGRQKAAVDADVQEAQRLGITGTPAFVVNGILMSGYKSADEFDALIREELGAQATASASGS
jgi:protein-disulfide isomerase